MIVLPWPGRKAWPAPSAIDSSMASRPTPTVRCLRPTSPLNAFASRFSARRAGPATGSFFSSAYVDAPPPGTTVRLPERTSRGDVSRLFG